MPALSATALAYASIATTVISTGVQLYGQEQQRKTAKRTAEYNAKVKENESIRQDMLTRENIRRKRLENRRILSKQRAQIAASGITFAGSPLEVLADNAATLELQVFDMANSYENQRRGYEAQAQNIRDEGQATANAIRLNQGTTLLNAGTNVALSTYNYKQQGVFK